MFVNVQNTTDPSLVEDPAKDKQFAEPAIDTMRMQKDEVRVLHLHYVTQRANLIILLLLQSVTIYYVKSSLF